MDERKKIMAAVYVLAAVALMVIGYAVYLYFQHDEKTVVPERKFELKTGEISLYQAGSDYVIYSDQKAYPIVKKAIMDAVMGINGVAFSGQIFPEDVGKGKKDPGGLTGINQLKDTNVGLGVFLGVQQELLTSYKSKDPAAYGKIDKDGYMIIPADQVVIFLSGEYKGLVFTRNDYKSKEWVAWKTDKAQVMKLVELLREGTKKYEK